MGDDRSDLVEVTPPPRHHDAWAAAIAAQPGLHPRRLLSGSSVLAVVAHPDDETLAMGATLASLAAAGTQVSVVCLTSGEAALDHVGVAVPGLAARRTAELENATAALGLADATTPGLPDGALETQEPLAREVVAAAVDRCGADQLVTLWRGDPHPDHRAAGRVAVAAAGAAGVPVVELALWAFHWTHPDDLPGHRLLPVEPDADAQTRRRRALDCYLSQTRPLHPGLEPVLPPAVVGWDREVALAAAVPA